MNRRELALWLALVMVATLALAWVIERRHILSFRAELDAWGSENTGS